EHGQNLRAALLQVNGAATRPGLLFIYNDAAFGVALGADEWPALLEIRFARNCEHGIAQGFGVEPAKRKLGEKTIVGIDRLQIADRGSWISPGIRDRRSAIRYRRRLLVDSRADNQSVHRLDAPARSHELGRQVIQ